MKSHTTYSTEEIKTIIDLRFNKKWTVKNIARKLDRSNAAIENVLHRYKAKERYQPYESVKTNVQTTNPEIEAYNASEETKERMNALLQRPDSDVEVKPMVIYQPEKFTAREMIKKLYDMGYRIEDNELVCYVKHNVNVKDIING